MQRIVVALVVLASAIADAHGLPPMTNGVSFASDDPNSLYVASTFGLLISHDRGCTFYWVCEAKVGYGDPYEPHYAVAHDGTIFATAFTGLRVSRDGGCSFTTATSELAVGDPGRIADRFVDAVALGSTGDVWAATGAGASNDVYVSHDNGVTFASSGLASSTIRWLSVAVAPSDPTRVYAVGNDNTPAAHLMRRDHAGWTESPLTGVQLSAQPTIVIAAVDSTNPDIVYIISSLPSGDRLYRSADGGTTFADAFTPTLGWIHDVVVRDAQTVYITTMVPAGSVAIGGPAYESTNGGVSFAPMAGAPTLQCLGIAPDGELVGCSANWEPDFMSVTRSTDGMTWSKVWRFVELAGALACPTEFTCEQSWDMVQQNFGTTGPACGVNVADAGGVELPMPTTGGCCDASGAPSLVWAFAVAGLLRRRRAT
jgi:hypothetical protein